jgi:hypothetical protein
VVRKLWVGNFTTGRHAPPCTRPHRLSMVLIEEMLFTTQDPQGMPCRPRDSVLDAFEVSHQLPVGDGPIEGLLLQARHLQIMVEDALTKGVAGGLGCLQRRDRLA